MFPHASASATRRRTCARGWPYGNRTHVHDRTSDRAAPADRGDLAPVRGEFAISRRQIAEHELTAVDIGRPIGHDGIHADREKRIPLRRDEPPPAVPSFCSKKSRRAKLAALLQPAKAIAFERFVAPLRELICLFCTSGAQHLVRAYLFWPDAVAKLAETIDDPVIGGLVHLARGVDTQSTDSQSLWSRRAPDSQTNRCNLRGVDRPLGRGNRQVWRKAGCFQ